MQRIKLEEISNNLCLHNFFVKGIVLAYERHKVYSDMCISSKTHFKISKDYLEIYKNMKHQNSNNEELFSGFLRNNLTRSNFAVYLMKLHFSCGSTYHAYRIYTKKRIYSLNPIPRRYCMKSNSALISAKFFDLCKFETVSIISAEFEIIQQEKKRTDNGVEKE